MPSAPARQCQGEGGGWEGEKVKGGEPSVGDREKTHGGGGEREIIRNNSLRRAATKTGLPRGRRKWERAGRRGVSGLFKRGKEKGLFSHDRVVLSHYIISRGSKKEKETRIEKKKQKQGRKKGRTHPLCPRPSVHGKRIPQRWQILEGGKANSKEIISGTLGGWRPWRKTEGEKSQ